jgi:hypothetical protein
MKKTSWYIDTESENPDLQFEVVNEEDNCFKKETIVYGNLSFFEKKEIEGFNRWVEAHTDEHSFADDVLNGIIDYIFSDNVDRSDSDVFEFCLKEILDEMQKEKFITEEEYYYFGEKIEEYLG